MIYTVHEKNKHILFYTARKLIFLASLWTRGRSSSATYSTPWQVCNFRKYQRLFFFSNNPEAGIIIHTVHAVIRKGNPGSSMLERSAFMRSSKYNLNGMIFSLLDVRASYRHQRIEDTVLPFDNVCVLFLDRAWDIAQFFNESNNSGPSDDKI